MGTAPIRRDGWVLPAGDANADPVWGVDGGVSLGLWPASGPRGLIRLYTPFLGQPHPRMLNFVAIEPVQGGRRSLSELERAADGHAGLPFLAAADRVAATAGKPIPAAQIQPDGDTLRVWIAPARFASGAAPLVCATLNRKQPRTVAFTIHARPDSAPMDFCILTATMGNYPRLRRLRLREGFADARHLWPAFPADSTDFAPWRSWPRESLPVENGEIVLDALSDEPDPAGARYDPAVPPPWRYQGMPAIQRWRTPDVPKVLARANGRVHYWAGGGPIPGGIAFENVELEAPFRDGQTFTWEAQDFPAVLG